MTDAAQQHSDGFQHTDMPVGEVLRRTREHYQQSIEDIEHALRIRASQIIAIESGDLTHIPGRVYAIGFVRTYSEFLGLDGDKMVELFKRQTANDVPAAELHYPAPASDSRLPPAWLIIICVILLFIIVGGWMGTNSDSRELVENIPPVPPEMQMSQEVEAIKSPQDEAKENADEPTIAEKPPEGIILNIIQNSWVEIRDKDRKKVISRVLKAGDQYYVPDRPDLTISIGNAAGVEIEVDGQPLKQLGEKGKVLRSIPLDAKYLKANFAAQKTAE